GKLAVPAAQAEMRFSADKDEFFGARMAAHGLHSVEAYFAELRRYTMLDRASDIRCPTLIVECEGDPIGGGGPSLAKAMGDLATLKHLSIADGAGGHCGWLGQRVWTDLVYGWLAKTLAQRG
ncbi:MAG: alpha/beta hydrolase family protein, partial [Thermomicrobiales bacterium]